MEASQGKVDEGVLQLVSQILLAAMDKTPWNQSKWLTTREVVRIPCHKKGCQRKKSDTVHTAVELQIDHGKGPFSAGLTAEPLAGGRADAAVSERSGNCARALPQLNGYYYPPVMGTEGGRVMVATYVSTRLAYSPFDSPVGSISCRLTTFAVRVPVKGSSMQTTLVNVYYPGGSKKIDEVAWLKNLNPDTSSWVVAGDFNVSNRLWDRTATDSNGLHLAETVSDSNLLLFNDGSITRIGHRGQRSTATDLTMVRPDLFHEAHWSTGVDHLQSDHCTWCWVRQTLSWQKRVEHLSTSTKKQTGSSSSPP